MLDLTESEHFSTHDEEGSTPKTSALTYVDTGNRHWMSALLFMLAVGHRRCAPWGKQR